MFQSLIEKANAQGLSGTPISTHDLLQNILTYIVNQLVSLMIGVAVIFFLWGVFQFVRNAESSDERKKGGMNMLWGVIGLFIMVTAYGILNLIIGTITRP